MFQKLKKSKMKNTSNQKGRKRKSSTSINSLFKEALLKKQIEKVGDSYKCNPCKKLFKKEEDTKNHWNNWNHWNFCILCEKVFPKNTEQDHLKEVHNIPNATEKQNGGDSNISLANNSNAKLDFDVSNSELSPKIKIGQF